MRTIKPATNSGVMQWGEDKFENRLAQEDLCNLRRNVSSGIMATAVNALLLAVVFWSLASKLLILGWLGVIAAISGCGLWRLAKASAGPGIDPAEAHRWTIELSIGLLLMGALWGGSSFIFLAADDANYRLIFMLVFASMIAGATISFSTLHFAALAFIVPATLLMTSCFVLLGDPGSLTAAGFVMLFSLFMLFITITSNRPSRGYFRTHFRLANLIDQYLESGVHGLATADSLEHGRASASSVETKLVGLDSVLRAILYQAPMVVIFADLRGNILYAFGQKSQLLEQCLGLLCGRSMVEVFSAHSDVINAYEQAQHRPEGATHTRFGDFDFEMVARPFKDADGNRIATIIVGMDISEELRSGRMQELFIETVNHQLRTPLTSLLGNLKLLYSWQDQPAPASASAARMLEVALRNAERILTIVEQIDNLQQIDDPIPDAELPVCELPGQAREVFRKLRTKDLPELSIETDVDDAVLLVSRKQIRQVLACLLDNAIQFSNAESEIKMGICSDRSNGKIKFVNVSIVNQAEPIPIEKQGHIFDRFVVGDSSDSRRHYGLGLGLFVARRMIESANGRLWLERSDASGTEFRFSIPTKLES